MLICILDCFKKIGFKKFTKSTIYYSVNIFITFLRKMYLIENMIKSENLHPIE